MIEAGRAALEERGDDGDAGLAGELGELLGGGAGNGLGEIEEAQVLALAEVLGAEKLGQTDDVGAEAGGFADALESGGEVGIGVGAHAHLDQRDLVFAGVRHEPRFILTKMRRKRKMG